MQITGKRVFTAVTLVGCTITLYQLFSKPQAVATPQNVEVARANAASFDQKIEQLERPHANDSTPVEVHFSSDEVSGEIAESTGAVPPPALNQTKAVSAPPLSANTAIGAGEVQVKGYQVQLEGDVARGQFVTAVAGKDVYVTLAGHLGSRNGYVTFDPTEFKVGDLSIPVSLVNSALQKKLAEQRDQLKLPEGIASLRVENGELVITAK